MNHRKLAYKDYTGIRMPDYVQGMELELFSYMDKKNLNDVDWWEYAPPMCIRMLAGRQPVRSVQFFSRQGLLKNS